MKLDNVCKAVQHSPVGSVSLGASTVCGVVYLAKVFVPVLAGSYNPLSSAENNLWFWVMVPGSGIAFLLALLSFGWERRTGPAMVSLSVLAVTENVVFCRNAVLDVDAVGGLVRVGGAGLIAAFFLAIALTGRRAITGEVILSFSLQPSRCPLFATMKSHSGPQ